MSTYYLESCLFFSQKNRKLKKKVWTVTWIWMTLAIFSKYTNYTKQLSIYYFLSKWITETYKQMWFILWSSKKKIRRELGQDGESGVMTMEVFIIDREAREIIRLVTSVRPFAWLQALSCLNRLTFDLDFWHERRPWPWLGWDHRSRS